jgi:predicted transcriptional regulator of viral defense system
MKYIEFYQYFRKFPVFSHREVKKVFPNLHSVQLTRWQKEGYLRSVVRGFYVLADFQQTFSLNEKFLCLIANKIRQPSYISLEMALSWYNIIPEGVYLITSVTSKTTANFDSSFGKFSFRKIKNELMFGYKTEVFENYSYKIATLEKTVLDYLYLNSKIENKEDFEGLRWNVSELGEKLNVEKMCQYLVVFANKKLNQRVENLLNYLKTN